MIFASTLRGECGAGNISSECYNALVGAPSDRREWGRRSNSQKLKIINSMRAKLPLLKSHHFSQQKRKKSIQVELGWGVDWGEWTVKEFASWMWKEKENQVKNWNKQCKKENSFSLVPYGTNRNFNSRGKGDIAFVHFPFLHVIITSGSIQFPVPWDYCFLSF